MYHEITLLKGIINAIVSGIVGDQLQLAEQGKNRVET